MVKEFFEGGGAAMENRNQVLTFIKSIYPGGLGGSYPQITWRNIIFMNNLIIFKLWFARNIKSFKSIQYKLEKDDARGEDNT